MITIRKATQEDVPTIQRLNHELFLSDNQWNHDLGCDWPFSEEGEKYFRDCVEQERFLSVVAEIDDKVVGYLNGSIKNPNAVYLGKRAEIDNIYVDEAVRKGGVGTALVNEFKKWAKDHGVDRLMVEAFSENEKAIEFYKNHGFEPYATRLSQKIKE